MPDKKLPVHFDPFHLAAQRGRLQGRISLSGMSRLAESGLGPAQGDAWVTLEFYPGPGKSVVCKGTLRAKLVTSCQRCLGEMNVNVDRVVELALVHSDAEAAQLWDEYETFEVSGDRVYTRDLVEEELVLALPLVPVHEDVAQCNIYTGDVEDSSPEPERERDNPFEVLKGLRNRSGPG